MAGEGISTQEELRELYGAPNPQGQIATCPQRGQAFVRFVAP
jgi:hypothetical protein